MCGFCLEHLVFDVIEKERSGKAVRHCGTAPDHVLQATGDIPAALKKVTAAAGRKKIVPLALVHDDVLLCRAIEQLMSDGFDSPAYQRLLRNRLFRHVLAEGCAPARRPQPARLPAAAEDVGQVQAVYDMATFTTADGAARLRGIGSNKSACQRLLVWYCGWWLAGGTVRCHDMGGVADEEGAVFRAVFRALFFSLCCLGRYRAARPLLLRLVTTPPACVPDFTGLDLWLQRQAALYLYDHFGLAPFLAELHEIRPALLYYVDLKRTLTVRQKGDILRVARERPGTVGTDDFFSLEEWLTRYE